MAMKTTRSTVGTVQPGLSEKAEDEGNLKASVITMCLRYQPRLFTDDDLDSIESQLIPTTQ